MIFKNVSEAELNEALVLTNKRFDNNVSMLVSNYGRALNVTLRVKNANKAHGVITGRKLNQQYVSCGYQKGVFAANGTACWHVHGYFFDMVLSVNPKAIIITMYGKIYINSYGVVVGNWINHDKGSIIEPLKYTDLCECKFNEKLRPLVCLECGKPFDEPSDSPVLFFCSDQCSRDFSHLDKKLRHQFNQQLRESKRFEDLPFETPVTWIDVDNIQRRGEL
jgi:hypothetical protein